MVESVAATADPDISIDSKLTSFGALEDTLNFGGEHDDMLNRMEQSEGHEFYSSRNNSRSQFSSAKDGLQLMERLSPRLPFEESFTSSTTEMTRFEENAFQTLLSQTFSTPIDNLGFQLDDASLYLGQELQLGSLPSPSPYNQIIPTAQMSPSSSQWKEISHFSKNVRTGIQQICVTMIIEMVCAYPRMMTSRETFPPFIHAHAPISDTNKDPNKLPEHIANCMGIAQLFAVRNDDTRPFIWATIRTEMRSFMTEMHNFTKYDTLSAVQASLLYIIVRAVEDVPQNADDDSEMLSIYNVSFP